MLLTAMLEQARSFRCGAALLSHLRRATRSFTTSRCLDEEKAAQPQTPATDSIELTVVGEVMYGIPMLIELEASNIYLPFA